MPERTDCKTDTPPSKRTGFLFILFFFLFVSTAFAQREITRLEEWLQEDRLDEIKDELPDVIKKYPDHPTVLFLQGVFARDADTALGFYEKIVANYGDSKYADNALFRIAQYYYSRKYYQKAADSFAYFIDHYPASRLNDDAQYLLCQSMMAQGKMDSAKECLRNFIKRSPRSPYVDLAVMDLESSHLWSDETVEKSLQQKTLPESKYKYALQVGAFSKKKNAQQVARKMQRAGLAARVVRINRARRTLYAVWVGKFETTALARNFARNHRDVLGKDYRIVDYNKK